MTHATTYEQYKDRKTTGHWHRNLKWVRLKHVPNAPLTLEQFGELIGFSYSFICLMENGKREIGPRVIEAVCDKCDISLYEFLICDLEHENFDLTDIFSDEDVEMEFDLDD